VLLELGEPGGFDITPSADRVLQAAISEGMDSRFSETERLALRLRFEGGLTAQEIGAHLDLTPEGG
jgi:hypothetical protein